jgi:Asp-tRNA(Asn)/Glu-tRNA(Gln) amidotransferase A subunit family amidase
VGVKDIYRVDGLPTRCGSALPEDLFEGPEACLVSWLKSQGALVLGKTVTTEFAYFEPGPTRNPQNPGHTPGGSSSGSAAAVAAGYCALALGSQTVGSVIRPAAFCGIVGFKPTHRRASLEGVIPYSPSLDHAGWFVHQADDLLLTANLRGAKDARPRARDAREDQQQAERAVLGVPCGAYLDQATGEGMAAFEAQVRRLEAAGRRVRRVPVMDDIDTINGRHNRLAAAEMADVHWDWFQRYEGLYRPRTAAWIREGLTVDPDEAEEGKESRAALRHALEGAMEDEDVDAWICPAATGPAPAGIEATGDPAMNLPWTHAGMPVATIPAGHAANDLPLGLQIIARCGEDAWLAALAVRLSQQLANA